MDVDKSTESPFTNSTNSMTTLMDYPFDVGYDWNVWGILPLVIIIIGTIGNGLTLVFTCSRRTKKTSFIIYLAALAIVDTLSLYTFFVWTWVRSMLQTGDILKTPVGCKLDFICNYWFTEWTSWLVVAISLERSFSTTLPHLVNEINSPKTGIIVVTVTGTVLFLVNSPFMFSFSSEAIVWADRTVYMCVTAGAFKEVFHVYWPWIHLSIYSFVPGLFIIIGNVTTVKAVISSSKFRGPAISKRAHQKNQNLVVISVLVSSSFLLLTGPHSIYSAIGTIRYGFFTPERLAIFNALRYMVLANHAVNFFLYILSGTKFRHDLKAVLHCTKKD